MKISQNLRINFWVRKTQARNSSQLPTIYCRISIGNQKSDISTNHKTHLSKWNNQIQRIKDTSWEAQQINTFLDEMIGKIIQIVSDIKKSNEILNVELIKFYLIENAKLEEKKLSEPKGIRYVMKKYLEDIVIKYKSNLISKGTLVCYKGSLGNLDKFLEHKKIKWETSLKQLNREFFYDFETFLLSTQKMAPNSAYKVLKHTRRMFSYAKHNGWIDESVNIRFNVRYTNPPRPLLTLDELKKLKNYDFGDALLNETRDIFLFTCFTGFAYEEVKSIETQHIAEIEGKFWVIIKRKKTGNEQRVMLLPQAISIIEKYKLNQAALKNNKILPVKHNHRYNALLKKIQEIMGFNVKMTSHLGRHIMASTIALSNHMPIETLSKILGHRSLKTTTIYAKVLDSKIIEDFTKVYSSLADKDFG